MTDLNKIEKSLVIAAPVSRVWRAIADAQAFGSWFGVKLNGQFEAGKPITGTFGEGINEAGIINFQKKLGVKPSGVRMPQPNSVFCTVDRIEPEQYFSFRWIPYGIDAEADPENEPTTLVEFHLESVPEGTRLLIRESGFEKVPAHRRERAFRMNEGGWAGQAQNIKDYVERS